MWRQVVSVQKNCLFFKENIFSITSIFLVMLLGYYLDIKDYAIIPLGSLVNRRNAFINITNLIRNSSNGPNGCQVVPKS